MDFFIKKYANMMKFYEISSWMQLGKLLYRNGFKADHCYESLFIADEVMDTFKH